MFCCLFGSAFLMPVEEGSGDAFIRLEEGSGSSNLQPRLDVEGSSEGSGESHLMPRLNVEGSGTVVEEAVVKIVDEDFEEEGSGGQFRFAELSEMGSGDEEAIVKLVEEDVNEAGSGDFRLAELGSGDAE